MPTWAWIVIVIVAALAVAVAVAAYIARQNQTKRLQERFGSEYDRTVSTRGEQRSAEKELVERERKREQLDIVPLTPEARDKYAESWRGVQTRFVDDPPGAVDEADRGIGQQIRPLEHDRRRAAKFTHIGDQAFIGLVPAPHPRTQRGSSAGGEAGIRAVWCG